MITRGASSSTGGKPPPNCDKLFFDPQLTPDSLMPYYRKNIYILSTTVCLASLSWYLVIPFLPLFIKQMGVSSKALPYWVGVTFAVQSLGSMVFQPFWGKLADTYGRKPMILRAGFCLAFVYYAMSVCKSPWQLALLRFLNGALTGFIPGSYALIATNTPEEIAPHYVATAQAAANVGLIAGPALGGFLSSLFGYRVAMQIAGTAVLLSTLIVARFVEERNRVNPGDPTSIIQDLHTALRSPVQLSLLFAVTFVWLFGSAISPYLTLYLKSLNGGSPDWVVGAVFSLPAIAFILTARWWTSLGERWGYEKSITLGLAAGGLLTLSLAFSRSIVPFGLAYFVTSIFTSALAPSISGLTITRVEESFRGRAYAIQQAAGTLGGFLAPLVAAKVSAALGVPAVFIFVGSAFVAGCFIFQILVRRWTTTNGTQ
ncbi:MAG: MFS transporter [Armatimonadota bacterium]|nr:MFS transporter [Armatimonadota bacterium]